MLSKKKKVLKEIIYLIVGFVIPGLSDDSKDAKLKSHVNSSSTITTIVIIIILLIVIFLFSFFLFKLWEKKKKEEHHARLMKLFEEDNELELELGLRE